MFVKAGPVQLLGNYQSTLSSSYYKQLVTLLQQSIQAGDYSGGQAFDQKALAALQTQSKAFSTLPQPSAGQLVLEESFNNPLTLLSAQFGALLAESSAFASQMTALLSVLGKDTTLIDQLLVEANLQAWASTIPAVTDAVQIMLDFGVGYGAIAPVSLTDIWTDPATGASYLNNPTLASNLVTTLLPGATVPCSGLTPSQTVTSTPINNLIWSYNADNAQSEVLSQDAWTKLSLLETKPLIDFNSSPNVVSTPSMNVLASPLVVSGVSNLGSLPVYVQTSFVGRQKHATISLINNKTVSLSPYTVETDEVYVFTGYGTADQQLLSSSTDYTVDVDGNLTSLTLPATVGITPSGATGVTMSHTSGLPSAGSVSIAGMTVNYTSITSTGLLGVTGVTAAIASGTSIQSTFDVFFQEEFPAYQCSIDQTNWSPLLMLDPDRPYPDDATSFPPIAWGVDSNGNQALPITDELGTPTSMCIEIGTAVPTQPYLLQVASQASSSTVGATAVLEVDLAQLNYLTVLNITPFTTFPMVLTKVETQAITSNTRQIVWNGSTPINRPTAIHLDQTLGVNPLVSKVFLTFYQPNYTLKQHTVTPSEALRLDIMSQLQAVLPFNARNVVSPPAEVYTGAQYEFGAANVSGETWKAVSGVFVSGPTRFTGIPELLQFDADFTAGPSGTESSSNVVNTIPSATNSSGVLVDQKDFAWAISNDTSGQAVDFYLCFQAFNSAGTVIKQNLAGCLLPTEGSGQCFSFTFPFTNKASVGSGALSSVDHVDFYIKIVHRKASAVVQRFMLQVTGQ